MAEISFAPSQDAYIAQWFPTRNFGAVPYLYVSRYEQAGDVYRSLVQFDLCSLFCNSIPPNSCIDHACLELWIYRNEIQAGSINLNVYRILQTWSENQVTWNNQPLIGSSADGTQSVAAGDSGKIEIDITDLAEGWYKGTIVNNGLLIKGKEDANDLVGFYSRKFPNTSLWPKLTVIYHQNCCVAVEP